MGFSLLLLSSCGNKLYLDDKSQAQMSKSVLYKQYALCHCIKVAYKDDSINLKDISEAIYQELSDYTIMGEKARMLDSFSVAKAKQIKPSQIADYNGRRAVLSDCIQFYHSKQLDSLVKRLIRDFK